MFGFLFAIIGTLTESARGASERTHSTLGPIYILILLLLVVVTNVRLRGIRSIAVLLALALVAVTLAWFNLWDRILNVIPYLSVNVDTNFYLVFSALAIPSFFEIKESGGCEIFLKRIGSDFF